MCSSDLAKYAAEVATIFKGTTLRSMLLDAYGFWKLGQIAWISAIVAFGAAALFLLLALAEILHLRRVPEEAEVFAKISHPVKVPQMA